MADSRWSQIVCLGGAENPIARASPPRMQTAVPGFSSPLPIGGCALGRRSQRQPRPPKRGSWGSRGVMLSSHPGPPARLSFRLGPAAPLGCGSALQPPAPCRRRESWAGGRSRRRRRRRQAAYTRLPVLHSELPKPAAAATAPAAAAPATAAAAT